MPRYTATFIATATVDATDATQANTLFNALAKGIEQYDIFLSLDDVTVQRVADTDTVPFIRTKGRSWAQAQRKLTDLRGAVNAEREVTIDGQQFGLVRLPNGTHAAVSMTHLDTFPYACHACGRAEDACSRSPCADVMGQRSR